MLVLPAQQKTTMPSEYDHPRLGALQAFLKMTHYRVYPLVPTDTPLCYRVASCCLRRVPNILTVILQKLLV